MHKLLMLALMTATALGASENFYRATVDPAAGLAVDKPYPAGKMLVFGGYSPPNAILPNLRELGFTAAGPVYGGAAGAAEFAKKAAALSLPVLYQLNVVYKDKPLNIPRFDEMLKNGEKIDWTAMEKAIAKSVHDALAASDSAILWWALTPEELRYWRADEMRYLQLATATIRKLDKRKRPIWMYIPGHYDQKALEHYTPYLDIIAQGYYPRAGATPRVWCRYWSENQVNAAKKSARPVLPGVVPEMFVEPKPEELAAIPSWVKHDVFMPLILGAKAVVVFSLAKRANFAAHDTYLDAYSVMAQALNGDQALGEVLLFAERPGTLQLEVTDGVRNVDYQRRDKSGQMTTVKSYPTLAWVDLKHVSGRYLFAGSSAPTPVTARLTGLPREKVAVHSAMTGQRLGTAENGEFTVEFPPYGIRLLKFLPYAE